LRIICFGDSITYGESDPINGGWADQLKNDYVLAYQDSIRQETVLYNLGVGGETTDGLAARFNNEYLSRAINSQKSLVIFSYGANDIVIHKNKNIVPIKYFIRNLSQCIEFAKSKKSEVILLGLTPISESIEGKENQHGNIRFDKDIKLYNQALEKLAQKNQVLFVDTYSKFCKKGKQNLLAKDGVHPNTNGHLVIYSIIKSKLNFNIDF